MIRIVVLSPAFDLRRRILQRLKPVRVQALVPEAAIEGLNGRVVGRLAAPTEVQNHPVRVRPEIHRRTDELCAVVAVDPLRQSAIEAQPLECGGDVLARQAAARLAREIRPTDLLRSDEPVAR